MRNSNNFRLPTIFVLLFVTRLALASDLVNRKGVIMSVDFFSGDGIACLERALLDEDVINDFYVRQKLLSLTYQELSDVVAFVEERPENKELQALATRVLVKRRGFFPLVQDIFIGNTPLLLDLPFSSGKTGNFRIDAMKPYSEHMYFPNLKVGPLRSALLLKEPFLWKSFESPSSDEKSFSSPRDPLVKRQAVELSIQMQEDAAGLSSSWSFFVPEDNKVEYYFSVRQIMKGHQGPSLHTVSDGDIIFVRNEHRFFCLERASGRVLWMLGSSKEDKEEKQYLTTYPPHQNPSGYEFLFEADHLYAELDGVLVSVDIHNRLSPVLRWESPLGEYRLCASPRLVGDTLVACLINPRGEVWVAGFLKDKGKLVWSDYVGLTSVLAPVSSLSDVRGNMVFFSLHHGALVAVDSRKGKISWVRQYDLKKLDYFQYWEKGSYLDGGVSFVPYDTEFLTFEGDTIFFKPKESETFYTLDSLSGAMIDSLTIDSDRYYFLGVFNGCFYLLRKPLDGKEKSFYEFQVIDFSTGVQLASYKMSGSEFRGFFSSQAGEYALKIDSSVYYFKNIESAILSVKHYATSSPGWLIGADGESFFLQEERSVIRMSLRSLKGVQAEGVRRARDGENAQTRVLAQPRFFGVSDEEFSSLSDGEIKNISEEDLALFIEAYRKKRDDKILSSFIERVRMIRGETVVDSFGVRLRLSALLDRMSGKESEEFLGLKRVREGKVAPINVRAAQGTLVPIKIIQGQDSLPFFLFFSFDQLICVEESGKILWERKIFYGPTTTYHHLIDPHKDKEIARLGSDFAEAYFTEGVLIINVGAQVVAVEALSGKYLWSMSVSEEDWMSLPYVNEDPFFLAYGVMRDYLKRASHQIVIVDAKRLIVTHQDRVYLLDLKTGFCEKMAQLPCNGFLSCFFEQGKTYLLTEDLKKMFILNEDLGLLREVSLDFLMTKDAFCDLFLLPSSIVLRQEEHLFVLAKESGDLTGQIKISKKGDVEPKLETYGDGFLIIDPFRGVRFYDIKEGLPQLAWEVELEGVDPHPVWFRPKKNSNFYFKAEHVIKFPFRRDCAFFMAQIDLESGKLISEKPLAGLSGIFYYMSELVSFDEGEFFIVATEWMGRCDRTAEFPEMSYKINLNSYLIREDLRNGGFNIVKPLNTSYGGTCSSVEGVQKTSLTKTKHLLLYDYHKKFLDSVAGKNS